MLSFKHFTYFTHPSNQETNCENDSYSFHVGNHYLKLCVQFQADIKEVLHTVVLVELLYHILTCYSSRPDAQLFNGQEEEQLNRELHDDMYRRQLINNLAKHVLFSKKKLQPLS